MIPNPLPRNADDMGMPPIAQLKIKKFRNLYFPESETMLPNDMAAEGSMMIAGAGTYQAHKLIKALPFVKNFNHAIDVGANVGTWARVLARLFYQVTAFEPVTDLCKCLALNIVEADRDRVMIHNCALGAEAGEAEMELRGRSSGWSHIRPTDRNGAQTLWRKQGPFDDIVKVQVRTLDSFALPKVDFLKIDVEGFELFVLNGGKQTIQRDKPTIIVEQKPGTPDRFGLGAKDAVRLLQQWGATMVFEWSGDYCMTWKK